MKKVFTIIYTTIISLVYIGAITFFAYNAISEYNHGLLRTQKRIDSIAMEITKIPDYKGPGSNEFVNELTNIIGSEYDFAFLNILVNGKSVYLYPSGADFASSTSKLIQNHEKAIKIGNNNVYIQASLFVLRPATIFNYARLAFIIILSATIVTIIVIMITGLTSSNEEKTLVVNPKRNKVEYVEPQPDEHIIHEEEKIETSSDINLKSDEKIEEEPEESYADADISDTENIISEPDFSSSEPILDDQNNYQEDKVEFHNPVKEQEEMIVPSVNEYSEFDSSADKELSLPGEESKPMELNQSNPAGLFSPVTGFGWQSYLETRLVNELNRATATETDLSVFIIKIPALLNCTSETLKDICTIIDENFQFRDLIFEYSDDCFSGIRINMSVDEAIVFADKIISELKVILPLNEKACYIGISSRSIRMVDARTILHEAQEALKHAVQDNAAPVIAFRADAAKYRKYVELD